MKSPYVIIYEQCKSEPWKCLPYFQIFLLSISFTNNDDSFNLSPSNFIICSVSLMSSMSLISSIQVVYYCKNVMEGYKIT